VAVFYTDVLVEPDVCIRIGQKRAVGNTEFFCHNTIVAQKGWTFLTGAGYYEQIQILALYFARG